ncbi:hypothetical protein ACGFIX_18965 [Nocardia salmonicida]|uniref:hypothetical protein n=1 Tax=Nocardia salmonicida TaxID=53431 RepID=UPI003712760C
MRARFQRRVIDVAYYREAITVLAAGNAERTPPTPLVSERTVIPIASRDASGRPMPNSYLSVSIGGHGVTEPRYGITSIEDHQPHPFGASGGYSNGSGALLRRISAYLAPDEAPPVEKNVPSRGGS